MYAWLPGPIQAALEEDSGGSDKYLPDVRDQPRSSGAWLPFPTEQTTR